MTRRVVITGMGIISPIGIGKGAFFRALCNGESGIRRIRSFDVSAHKTKTGAEIGDIGFDKAIARMNISQLSKWVCQSAQMALRDSGIDLGRVDKKRAGLVLGTFLGEIGAIKMGENGGRKPSRYRWSQVTEDTAEYFGIEGCRTTICTACTSGANAIGYAFDLIRYGKAEVVLAGSYEMLGDFVYAGMNAVRALAEEMHPFGAERRGTVLGEAAAILVLESEGSALGREANIYAEIGGYGLSNDAFHLLTPHPEGEGAARAMRFALEDSGLGIEDVDYINAHGTGTKLNDKIETKAIKRVFGKRAYRIPVSSIKAHTGHTLGASGSVEAIASIMAITEGVIPPTINHSSPDPVCDLDYVLEGARTKEIEVVLSNSFGFGGSNGSLVFKKYERQNAGPNATPKYPFAITGRAIASEEDVSCANDGSADTMDRISVLGLRLAKKALADAKLTINSGNAERIGLILSSFSGCADMTDRFYEEMLVKGPRVASPLFFSNCFPSAATGIIAKELGIKGFCSTMCGLEGNIGIAVDLASWVLETGKAEAVVVEDIGVDGDASSWRNRVFVLV